MKSCVVVPVLNESARIQAIVNESKKYVDRVIVVDDGSVHTKRVPSELADQKVTILYHSINLGKGAALKTGCEAAIKLGMENIVLMDGDGQHKPSDIPRFLKELESKKVDVVFGSRKIGKDMPLMMMFGNKFLSLATSLLFGIYISDTQSGFRAFAARIYPSIRWNSDRYAVETEMIVNVGKKKCTFGEIEIDTIYLDDYKGTTVLDGVKIFFNILIWRIL